ncbi:hypothetical protein ODJ79_11365 [Actinoplanes sp. KI2]|uniref:hypothetical protein n=1 Tax=Actinoplanes sp. KI2 TaxID=2983315 RepID=UPI0021D5AD0A|nr:hypothetical protein [Actinoplanes sp. KI2]MCU7724315.1 hypothetical protein [Actinoplanes sp. KI2]
MRRRHDVKTKKLRAVAVAALALLPLAGCADNAAQASSSAVGDKKIEQPFSIFLGDAIGVVDYAQLKVLNQCLADKGYPQNLRVMASGPRNPFPQLIVTEATFGPASEDDAKRRGFGQDEPATPPAVVSSDPTYDRVSDQCAEDAWKKLSPNAKEVYYSYFDLGNALGMPFLLTVNQRMGQARWDQLLSCLAGKGYQTTKKADFYRYPDPGLFGVPLGSDTPDPAASWVPKHVPGTVEVGPAVPARSYTPAPREADFALAWYRCRRDTGIDKEQMATVMQVEGELVKKNETALSELNPQVEQVAKQAAALIGQS